MPEKIDILIKNGSVIEPDKKTICKKDISIRDGYVVDYDKTINYEIKDEINAEGYYVSPGWVDSHVHIFKEGTEPGFDADLNLIPMGITAAIDGGSSGAGNWPVFKRTVVDNSYLIFFIQSMFPRLDKLRKVIRKMLIRIILMKWLSVIFSKVTRNMHVA